MRLLRATIPARLMLKVDCDADVPPVLADVTQMQQIVINLVTNAMQANPGGPGRIDVRLDTVMLDAALAQTQPALLALHDNHPGRTVRLRVSDDGPGMDAATLKRIFDPFFTTKAVDEGTGLGLSVVHGIVQAHEGAIVVASEPGKGATFTIYLPTARVQAGVLPPDEIVAAPAIRSTDGQHILYIDDDEALVFMVERLMERRGCRISGFTDQREALAARVVRTIRSDLPVAIASGFIDETLHAQADAAGVRELIFKANAVEDLCDAFARLAQTVTLR